MTEKTTQPKKTAGAFDIRNIIGSLLGIYGVILLLVGIFGDAEEQKTGGVNANLWTGLTDGKLYSTELRTVWDGVLEAQFAFNRGTLT